MMIIWRVIGMHQTENLLIKEKYAIISKHYAIMIT